MPKKTLAPSRAVTTRDPKGRKFMSIVEAGYNKAGLSKEEAQRVNEATGLSSLVDSFIAENRCANRFKDEEEKSSYRYLSGYRKPVEVSDQVDILRSHWPQLNPDLALRYLREVYPTIQLPSWVEGPFALIRPGFFSDQYGEELAEVLKALAKDRQGKFVNYREGQLSPEYLQQSERTLSHLGALVKQQPESDILISPAQFGIRHRGRSIRRAREVFVAGEYGKGAKDVGTMLLTHPTRLQHLDDLWIDCAGDDFSPDADGRFDRAPYFDFRDGGLGFGARWVGHAYDDYGSASGFSPQG